MHSAIGIAVLSIALCGIAGAPVFAQESDGNLERLVRQDCGSCHGMTLKGGLGPDLRAARLAGRDKAEIARIILDGVPGTAMPPWRPLLSESDALWIASYLLSEDGK
ncbi:MAG: cytochrome c [Hyphomicrobium sp.]|jgi:cytochrome c55X|nr:cytochrome c [Hyphomicrobium sp.]